MDKKDTKKACCCAEAQREYPGAQIDCADDNKVNPKMVKEDVKDLNNNPRNNDL